MVTVDGGYRRLSGESDHFSLQTDKQTLHHYIYIVIIIIIILGLHHHKQREPGGQDLEPGTSPLLAAHPPRLPFQQIAPPPHPGDRLGSKTHLQLLEEGRLCLASLERRGRLQVYCRSAFPHPISANVTSGGTLFESGQF